MFDKSKAISQLKVDGKMTQNGADKVGKLQAFAWIILAIGIAIGIILFALTPIIPYLLLMFSPIQG